MANVLGVYNPIFYAQEALIHLENALGMAARVHRGFDAERRTFDQGDTINIRRPSSFVVNDAPSTAQDLNTDTVALQLSKWREVKFKLSDKELAFTTERIINDHIRPATYALANDIDLVLTDLGLEVGHFTTATATSVPADIVAARKNLFDRGVPLTGPQFVHLMADGDLEADWLANSAFSQQQGAGDSGVNTQRTGFLGQKYGFEIFANQNVANNSADTLTITGAQTTVGAAAKGATQVTLTAATSLTGDLKRGNVISFSGIGDTEKYAVVADATASGNQITVTLGTPLAVAQSGGETWVLESGPDAAHSNPMAFHRNAFAIAFGKLPDQLPQQLGAQVASVQDPKSGISVRSRLYYVGNSSEVHVALDVLFGVKTLDARLACRLLN